MKTADLGDWATYSDLHLMHDNLGGSVTGGDLNPERAVISVGTEFLSQTQDAQPFKLRADNPIYQAKN